MFATHNVAQDPKFKGQVSIIMGMVYRHQGSRKFAAIGEPTKDKKLEGSLASAARQFLG